MLKVELKFAPRYRKCFWSAQRRGAKLNFAGKFGIVTVRIYTLEVRQLVIYCDNYVLLDGKLWQQPG